MNILDLFALIPGNIAQGLIYGIMAVGVYITYKILDIADLTVDGTMCTGGAVCAVMIASGKPVWLSLICAAAAGMLAGMATGLLHTFLGIPAILAGILTQSGLYTINLKIMGAASKSLAGHTDKLLIASVRIYEGSFLNNPILIVGIIVIVMIALLYWFFGTELGCALRSTGCNENMSRAQGINTNVTKVLGLMISNGLVAFSSALFAQYNNNCEINVGRGAIVIGLASVIIGLGVFGKIFHNFALRLVAVVFGAIIYYLVLSIVMWLGFSPDLLKLLSSIVIAAFLGAPYIKKKYFTNVKNVKGGEA